MAAIAVSVTGDAASDLIESLVPSLWIFVAPLGLPGRYQPVSAMSVSKFVDRPLARGAGSSRLVGALLLKIYDTDFIWSCPP